MSSAATATTCYQKTPGFANTKGQAFETKVSALVFLRGLNSDLDFQLASNVKGAGALDDVVLRIKGDLGKWVSYFIQLKHKESSSITRAMLTNPKYKDFFLGKYSDSYQEIKEAMSATERQVLFDGNIEESVFVIFTNAEPNSNLGEERQGLEQIDEFLGSNSGKVFKFDPDGKTEAEEAIGTSLKEFSLKKQKDLLKKSGIEDENIISEAQKIIANDWKDFLKRLRIFAAQPSEDEYDDLLKDELQKAVGEDNDDIDMDRLLACFVENMKSWFENKNDILHRGSDLFVSARHRVLAETVSFFEVKTNKLDLVFAEEALSSLREVLGAKNPVVLVGSSEQSSRLTCTQLLQTFGSSNYLFLGSECFLSNQDAVVSEWGRGQHNTLVVSVNNRDSTTDESHLNLILELCKTAVYPERRLFIVAHDLTEPVSGLPHLKVTFKFSNLALSSRKGFLNTKFKLQGRLVSLRTYLDNCCNDDIDILSASSVVEIIETGPKLSVGKVLIEPIKHYVTRSLKPAEANDSEPVFPKTVLDLDDRVVIVCGEPGMGKSTLVTHLAKATKEAHPHLWVVSIALNDHTLLFAEGQHEDATGFLLAAAKIEPFLEQLMFRLALEVIGNVVVILDGYDEIAPTYIDHCFLLLSNLLKTKAKKIWITTRISVKDELERRLSTSALRLCAFSEEDQRSYLKQYWTFSACQSRKKVLPEDELDDLISRLLKISHRSVGNDFLGIPLQAQMIAEVFVDHSTSSVEALTLPETLDLLQLLELFAEKKLEVFVQDRRKVKPYYTDYKTELLDTRTKYLNNHMEAALPVILTDSYVMELQSKNAIGDLTEFLKKIDSGEDKTGFINSTINGKARFVHRVFSEYFVATWFAAHLSEYAQTFGEEKYHKYFGGDPTVIILLCDLILAKDCPLHTAVLTQDVARVDALLKAGVDVNGRDSVGRTPLHLLAACGAKSATHMMLIEILDLLIKIPGIDLDIKDTDLIRGAPLLYAAMNGQLYMLNRLLSYKANAEYLGTTSMDGALENFCIEHILDNDMDILLSVCLDNCPDFYDKVTLHFSRRIYSRLGHGPLAATCLSGCESVAEELTKRGYDINTSLPKDQTEEYPLHRAALSGDQENLELLIANARISFSSPNGEQNRLHFHDFINSKDGFGQTALQLAAVRGHPNIVAFLICNGANATIQDNKGLTCLHWAVCSNQPSLVSTMLGCLREADRSAFVNLEDKWKHTALHDAARRGYLETVKILVKAGGMIAPVDGRSSPLMRAANSGHLDVIKYLVAVFSGECDSDGAKWVDSTDNDGRTTAGKLAADWPVIVNLGDNSGRTALLYAAWEGHLEIVKTLVSAGAKMVPDKYGQTPMMFATSKHMDVLEYLMSAFDGECDSKGVKWIDSQDASGMTVTDRLPSEVQNV